MAVARSLAVVVAAASAAVASANVTAVATGAPIDVWAAVDFLHECHFVDVPDIPARAFEVSPGHVKMVVGSTAYHHMSGPSVLAQTRSCAIAFNKTADPNPANFAANEFLDSTIAFPNGTVVSLVHTEYPGNSYNTTGPNAPECKDGGYPTCWTVTIGLAISHDFGATWQHARPPPNHLVASVPYKYNQTQVASGWGDPSNILKHPEDGFYYAAIWNRNQVGLQAPGICMMRTNDLTDPSSWRAWDGSDYTVSFVSPYTMPPEDAGKHVCTVTNLPAGDTSTGCAPAGLVWSADLETFVVTLGCGRGFKFATSDDLIHWGPAAELDIKQQMPANVSVMVRAQNYPTFMDPSAPSKYGDANFYTVGPEPYLFWVSIGDSPYHYGRHLWATPFKLEKTPQGAP